MIALNDLARHHAPLRAELEAAMARVHARGWYILGPEVEAFEREFAAFVGAAECIAVGNGTDALELAFRALGIGPGAAVATAANAGMYATTAIRAAGARPSYVEVDASTLLMDPTALAATLAAPAGTMGAVVVTHLYGRMADVERLGRVARERGAPLVEDCAQAHGARSGGRMAGTHGTLGCYSFYPTKNLGALGDAGAIVTSDRDLAAKLRALRTYGWGAKYHCAMEGGMNSRMDELQAAALRAKLPHLDAWNLRRRGIAAHYAATIRHPDIALPVPAEEGTDVSHLYVVRAKDRESLRAHLAASGVATDIHYPVPDHRQPGAGDVPPQGLPVTERACAEVLSLPCYPELTAAEIDAVAAACNRWQPRSQPRWEPVTRS
jgi:dTDP-4-amino-4,6-dideoxygalactose transaminase